MRDRFNFFSWATVTFHFMWTQIKILHFSTKRSFVKAVVLYNGACKVLCINPATPVSNIFR